jgi:hypothetical protein
MPPQSEAVPHDLNAHRYLGAKLPALPSYILLFAIPIAERDIQTTGPRVQKSVANKADDVLDRPRVHTAVASRTDPE